MRIVLIIVMVLAMLVSTGMGVAIGNHNLFSEEAKDLYKMAEAAGEAGAEIAAGPRNSGIGGLVVGLLALVMVVVTFMKKTKPIQIVAGLIVVLAIIFIAISPSGEGTATPRNQALIYGLAGIVTAICGFLAEKKRAS